ncbi:unnamed protein product [Mytilus coruscus]|uniref:Uncharacterized protein n=1 Tax=Mytilus coruscus TaxID=42192 RepID=A0A6J8AH18_MYTCO|nr:unnamed protein product [Mytilus coruscus]
MAYSQEEDLLSLSSHCDRDMDGICSEENLHESFSFPRRYSSPTGTVPETYFVIEPRVVRENRFDIDSKFYRECDVPTHDTGIHQYVQRFLIQKFVKEAPYFKPKVIGTSSHTISTPSFIQSASISGNNAVSNVPVASTPTYKEHFPLSSTCYTPYPESQITHTRPPYSLSSNQRETFEESVYTLPKARPPYPLDPCQPNRFSNFEQNPQSNAFLHSDRDPLRVPIYTQGPSNPHSVRQTGTIFESSHQHRDNFLHSRFSVSSHLTQNVPAQAMVTNSLLGQNLIGHSGQAMSNPLQANHYPMDSTMSNPVQANHYPMDSAMSNPVQANHYQMNSAMSNPVQANHYPMNLAMSNPVQASHYQMNLAMSNPIQQTMNNPMGPNMNHHMVPPFPNHQFKTGTNLTNTMWSATQPSMPGQFYNQNPVYLNPNAGFHHSNSRRKQKEPDTFDWKSTDWLDYIIQFEKVANWNEWVF